MYATIYNSQKKSGTEVISSICSSPNHQIGSDRYDPLFATFGQRFKVEGNFCTKSDCPNSNLKLKRNSN